MTKLNKTDFTILAKRGTEAQIEATSPVPIQFQGEFAYSTDKKEFYISDGSSFLKPAHWDVATGGINYAGGNVGIGEPTATALLHIDGGTATNPALKFNAGTLLTTPEVGSIEFADDRFYITNVGTQRAIDRTSGVKITTTTVANTTTETTLHTGTLGANDLKVGNLLKFDANGVISSFNAAQVLTIRFYIGSTVVSSETITGSTFSSEPWDADLILAVRSVGVSGSISVHSDLSYGGATLSSTSKQSGSIETIDTTVAENLTVTAQWGAANAGNTVSAYQGFFEFKN